MTRARPRILIVGGYGAFGQRAAGRLAREEDLDIVIAGRAMPRAQSAADALRATAFAGVSAAVVDASAPDRAELAGLAPTVVINASGPFQHQDFALAQACIDVGAHYIDLADATDFVVGFADNKQLDEQARAAGVLAVSGASTVPAISSAIADHYRHDFQRIDTIRYGISPGNSFDPGPATTASILGAIGKPFTVRRNGQRQTVYGWQGLSRHRFPAIGNRWMSYCNVPDLALFAERYPDLRTIDFRAGVEVGVFHLGLWLLSWPSRWGLLSRPESLVKPLLAGKRLLRFLGTDTGGMFMSIEGADAAGQAKRLAWHLEALSGHGPYIPTTPAIILARKLARGQLAERGARACLGLVTLPEIERELADLDIRKGLS